MKKEETVQDTENISKRGRNGKGKKPGIKIQLMLMAIMPAVVISIVLTLYAKNVLTDGLQTEALNGLELLAEATMAGYDNKPGDYRYEDGVLYKGDTNLTESMEELDAYVKGSNAEVTVCFGPTRALTTLIDNTTGQRIVGTDVSDTVWKTVQQGEIYTSVKIEINGMNYAACYEPLHNADGSIVGIVFAGQPTADIQSFISQKVTAFTLVALVLFLVFSIVGYVFVNQIANCLLKTENILKKLATGDLTVEVDHTLLSRGDEIGAMGEALHGLITKLHTIVSDLQESAGKLSETGKNLDDMANQSSHATEEISRAVDEISKGAVSQAEEIETASGQIVDIGTMIEKIVSSVEMLTATADNMGQAKDASMNTMHLLNDSNDRTVTAINSIAEQIQLTNASIQRISEAAELITSIASQTNLLSLNASIESARAGEAGRGFAVVATEIQKLAVQSNDTAVEIQGIIDKLQQESQKTVEQMNHAEGLMKEQQEKLEDTRKKFTDVSDGIQVSRQETETIQGRADKADQSRTKIMDVISNLSAISEENAASAEETTASMEELNATLNLLAEEASGLKEIAVSLHQDMQFFHI